MVNNQMRWRTSAKDVLMSFPQNIVLRRFFRQRRGDLAGFGLLTGLIAVVAIGGVTLVGTKTNVIFGGAESRIDEALNDAAGQTPPQTPATPADTTPDAFSIVDETNAAGNSVITFSPLTLTGFTDPASVTVSGDGSPESMINGGGAWLTSGTIQPGSNLTVRMTSGIEDGSTRNALLTVGGISDGFSVTTKNSVPSSLFASLSNAAPNLPHVSADATWPTGLGTFAASLTTSDGGGNPRILVNNIWPSAFEDANGDPQPITPYQNFLSYEDVNGDRQPVQCNGTIADGNGAFIDTLLLTKSFSSTTLVGGERLTLCVDSPAFGQTRTVTLSIGAYVYTWPVGSRSFDTTPDAFSFTDQTDVSGNTLTTSASIRPNGYLDPTTVSVTGDGSPQISVNNSGWVTTAYIQPNDSIRVRLTSGPEDGSTRDAVVTVGGISDSFSVTTKNSVPSSLFASLSNAAPNLPHVSADATWPTGLGTLAASLTTSDGGGNPRILVNAWPAMWEDEGSGSSTSIEQGPGPLQWVDYGSGFGVPVLCEGNFFPDPSDPGIKTPTSLVSKSFGSTTLSGGEKLTLCVEAPPAGTSRVVNLHIGSLSYSWQVNSAP